MRTWFVSGLAVAAVALCLSAPPASAQIDVNVNGQPVAFNGVQPRMVNGRVMVPLRGVLETLGATVDWDPLSHTVIATQGNKEIDLPIGSRTGTVDGRRVRLDVPAMTIAGATMVPLRFVSEALGANVVWSSATNLVSINTTGNGDEVATDSGNSDFRINNGSTRRFAAHRSDRAVIGAGTVVPVTLDESLSSDESHVGDRFTATVQPGNDAAGLPDGARFDGVVREAIPAGNGRPGLLSVGFNQIEFPNGDTMPISASAISLNSKYVTHNGSGDLVARGTRRNQQWKWVGIGAGAGLLLGTVTKGNALLDTLLGAGAGYLYNQLQSKGANNVSLDTGTRVGVRLDRRFSYNPAVVGISR